MWCGWTPADPINLHPERGIELAADLPIDHHVNSNRRHLCLTVIISIGYEIRAGTEEVDSAVLLSTVCSVYCVLHKRSIIHQCTCALADCGFYVCHAAPPTANSIIMWKRGLVHRMILYCMRCVFYFSSHRWQAEGSYCF